MNSLYEKLNKPNYLFDSHCHLNAEIYDQDRDAVVKNAIENGVKEIWDIAIDLESSKKAIENAKKYESVKAVVGIDPEAFTYGSEWFVELSVDERWFEKVYEDLKKLIEDNKEQIIAIGETGLDNYWNQISIEKGELSKADAEKLLNFQEKLFRIHLELANDFDLPLSIHSRAAELKCIEIVKNYDVTGIFHSFTGDYEIAKRILDTGWNLGVNGIITFKNAEELRLIYRKLLGISFPFEGKVSRESGRKGFTSSFLYQKGIYIETDGPYLSPEGKRGERNVPGNVKNIYDQFMRI